MAELNLHLLDVGQGEATLLDFPDGTFALVDAGPRDDAAAVLPEVEARVADGKRFRFLVISHWDSDHVSGVPEIVRSCPPEVVYLPGIALDLIQRAFRAARDEEAAVLAEVVQRSIERLDRKPLSAPEELSLDLDWIKIYALSPSSHVHDDIGAALDSGTFNPKTFRNRCSLALWIEAGERTLFLTGEAEGDQYRDMAECFRKPWCRNLFGKDPRAHWLKLSHHGARTNNPTDLFQFFARRNGFVASVSAGGRYGHPHPTPLRCAHFDFGGRMLCTNLGQACGFILAHGHDPRSFGDSESVTGLPNPTSKCYGTITVVVPSPAEGGATTVVGQCHRGDCPYGGPQGSVAI